MTTRGLHEKAIVATGPSAATGVAFRYGGVLRVAVIAKATFAFAADAAMPRAPAQAIFEADMHHGGNPMRSIRFSSDRAPYLERGEVFFTGHACAPGGRPVEEMPVRLAIFDRTGALLDKTLTVRKPGGFEKLSLVYENAFGGIGWLDNPLGVGCEAASRAPSIVDPSDERRTAGFGPIGTHWPARRKLLGATPRAALGGAIAEIPEGFAWSYFQAAPLDQRIGFLQGDEWIILEGLHSTLPRFRTRLPGARGLARVYGLSPFGVTEGQPLLLHADTLRIDGDEQICTLTFRGAFPVHTEEALAALRVLAGVMIPGDLFDWSDPAETSDSAASPSASGNVVSSPRTSSPDEGDLARVRGGDFEGTMALESALERGAPLVLTRVAPSAGERAPRQPLPFSGESSAPSPVSQRAAPSAFSGTVALDPMIGMAASQRRALPFSEKQPPPQPPSSAPSATAAPPAPPAAVPSEPPSAAAAPPPPPAAPPQQAPVAASEVRWAPAPEPAPAPRAARPPTPAPATASPALKKGLYGRFGK